MTHKILNFHSTVDASFPIGGRPLDIPDTQTSDDYSLDDPQDVLSLYWARGQATEVLFGDLVVERYGFNKDKYSLYIVDNDVEEFQGGDIRVVQRLGGGL